mgnify:CR=1 FL=1
MQLGYKIIDGFLASPTRGNLFLLNRVLALSIPFNAPHGFKIKKLNQDAVVISLPNRKLNHNHLGGVHACAIATVGEFCAGMSILALFGISKYRLILSELNAKYTYQGRSDLEGICLPTQMDKEAIEKSLLENEKHLQTLQTIIRDTNGKEVASVTTIWQLKPWEMVKTKN